MSDYSLDVGLQQLWTDEGNNRTRVRLYVNVYAGNTYYTNYATDAYIHIDVGAGNIEGQTNWTPWAIAQPTQTSLNGNYTTTTIWIGDYWFNHDANGYASYRVYGSFESWGTYGTPTLWDDTGWTTAGLPNYDRKPATPTSLTSTVNADKTVTLNVNAVSSPAGTATYHFQYSKDGGAYGTEQTTTSTSYTYSGLTPGSTYTFRVWATNSDGTGGTYTQPSGTFIPSGGKRYNGTAYIATQTAKRFDGTNFVTIVTAKRYDGSSWVNLS